MQSHQHIHFRSNMALMFTAHTRILLAFARTTACIFRTACDLVCSRVLEKLLTVCSEEHALMFFRRVAEHTPKLLENR